MTLFHSALNGTKLIWSINISIYVVASYFQVPQLCTPFWSFSFWFWFFFFKQKYVHVVNNKLHKNQTNYKNKAKKHIYAFAQATAFIFSLIEFKHVSEKRTENIAVFGNIVFLFLPLFFEYSYIHQILQFSVGKFDLFAFCLHLDTYAQNVSTGCTNITENSVTYWTCRLLITKTNIH